MGKYCCLISGMIGYTLGSRMGMMRRCACKIKRRTMRMLKRKMGL